MSIVEFSGLTLSTKWLPREGGRVILIGILLLGIALRIHDLEGQSMWSDEGLSLYRSSLTVPEIMTNVISVDGVESKDTTPQLYFLLLHYFRALTGETVFSMRYLGVAASTLSIPLIYAFTVIIFGRRTALLAALLMTISPFHIWQSQVLRNYGLFLTINLLAMYGLARFALSRPGRGRNKWLLLWAAAVLLGIYTHYYGFFIFVYGLLVLAIIFLRNWNLAQLARRWQSWLALGLLALVLMPAVFVSYERFIAGQQVDFYRIPAFVVLKHAASAFSVGVEPSLTQPWWRVLPVVLIGFCGLWFGWLKRPKATSLLLGYQVVPLALLLLISLVNPLYNGVRHLLIGLPPFIMFLAAGILGPFHLKETDGMNARFQQLWKILGPSLFVLVLVNQLTWLNAQYNSPRLIRDDIRGAAVYLNDNALPNDIVILHDSLIKYTFDYYYNGAAPVEAVPKYGEQDPEAAIEMLIKLARGRDRIWFLTRPSPRHGLDVNALPDWIEKNWIHSYSRTFPNMWLRVRLDAYQPSVLVEGMPDSTTPVGITWDQKLRLQGYEIPAKVQSGAILSMDFYLSQPTTTAEQHTMSLWLEDRHGERWSQINQTIPEGIPPSSTLADTLMRYENRVMIPVGIPPGDYQLWLRLVRTVDGQVVPMSSGDTDLFLSNVSVDSASCDASPSAFEVDTASAARFGDALELKGYSIPRNEIRPGHGIDVDLLWCAVDLLASDYTWQLRLMDRSRKVVGDASGFLSTPLYPPHEWKKGELIKGKATLITPARLASGSYDLKLSVSEPGSDQGLSVGWVPGRREFQLGSIKVEEWPMETELPSISNPLQAEFGQPPIIELHGYELSTDQPAIGDQLDLSLFWRSLSDDIDLSYTVFVHLTPADSDIPITQADAKPVSGFRPTTSWRSGEVISDRHQLDIPTEIKPGIYDLWIGLYDAGTDLRLPVFRANEAIEIDRLFLKELQVK